MPPEISGSPTEKAAKAAVMHQGITKKDITKIESL